MDSLDGHQGDVDALKRHQKAEKWLGRRWTWEEKTNQLLLWIRYAYLEE